MHAASEKSDLAWYFAAELACDEFPAANSAAAKSHQLSPENPASADSSNDIPEQPYMLFGRCEYDQAYSHVAMDTAANL